MRLVKIASGGLIGGIIGYFVGVIIACDWLIPNSNLCGIFGVFITGPLGLIAGAIIGWVFSRPKATSRH